MAFCVACIIQVQNIASPDSTGIDSVLKKCFFFIRVRSVLFVVGQILLVVDQVKICNNYIQFAWDIQFIWEMVKLHWHDFAVSLDYVMVLIC